MFFIFRSLEDQGGFLQILWDAKEGDEGEKVRGKALMTATVLTSKLRA